MTDPPTKRQVRYASSRAMPVALLVIAGVLLLVRIGLGIFARTEVPAGSIPEVSLRTSSGISAPPRTDLVAWREPGSGAEEEALRTAKPLLYDFAADWCGPCRMMQAEIFSDPGLAGQIDSMFVPVRVRDRLREEGRNPAAVDSLQNRYEVHAFPTLVVASADGSRHEKLVGYPGSARTMDWIAENFGSVTESPSSARP
ncbi:MAG: thioredoxin fold domain-containing protein [Candidatus Eiseniibacteriota bacterium]